VLRPALVVMIIVVARDPGRPGRVLLVIVSLSVAGHLSCGAVPGRGCRLSPRRERRWPVLPVMVRLFPVLLASSSPGVLSGWRPLNLEESP
jgi:hypothetical protein